MAVGAAFILATILTAIRLQSPPSGAVYCGQAFRGGITDYGGVGRGRLRQGPKSKRCGDGHYLAGRCPIAARDCRTGREETAKAVTRLTTNRISAPRRASNGRLRCRAGITADFRSGLLVLTTFGRGFTAMARSMVSPVSRPNGRHAVSCVSRNQTPSKTSGGHITTGGSQAIYCPWSSSGRGPSGTST